MNAAAEETALVVEKRFKWLARGIVAASFIAVTQLITREKFELSHYVAVVCFGLSLPWSIIVAVWPTTEQAATTRAQNVRFWTIIFTPYLSIAFITGVGALFWSFGRAAFVAFCFGSIIAVTFIEWSPKSKRLPEFLRSDSTGRGGLGV